MGAELASFNVMFKNERVCLNVVLQYSERGMHNLTLKLRLQRSIPAKRMMKSYIPARKTTISYCHDYECHNLLGYPITKLCVITSHHNS